MSSRFGIEIRRITNSPMKIVLIGLVCLLAVFFSYSTVNAQSKKTIILVRHAEKDVSDAADKSDPVLTAEGRARAILLLKAVKKYKPQEIFSTDYQRTRDTAEPTARYRNKQVQIYDASKPGDLITKIIAGRSKRYLIVGHSNTIPPLANMLAKKEIFRNLLDGEHGVIWVIRLKKGELKKVEILPY